MLPLLWLLLPQLLAAREFDTVAETTYRQVTWDDFKGKELRGNRWDDGTWAHIVSGIKIEPFRIATRQDEAGLWLAEPETVDAYGVMDKLLSGAAPGTANLQVLAHEQLHFDVTEAFARRLTVRLLAVVGRGDDPESAVEDLHAKVKVAYDAIDRELFAFQGRYDGETRHGTRRKAQKKWSVRVRELFAAAATELEAARAAAGTVP